MLFRFIELPSSSQEVFLFSVILLMKNQAFLLTFFLFSSILTLTKYSVRVSAVSFISLLRKLAIIT